VLLLTHLVEADVNADVFGAHFLRREFLDGLDCTRRTLLVRTVLIAFHDDNTHNRKKKKKKKD
jgi:hypothetical protein